MVNTGVARTGIWRETPLAVRAFTALLGPLLFDTVRTSAANPVALSVQTSVPPAAYWPKPGRPERWTPLALDPAVTARVMASSRELAGV